MTDTDLQLVPSPPAISKHFEIEGISFANSIAHPVLGNYWQDFHDRLHWSKDMPDISATEEGINLAILAIRFFDEDHRILAMPPAREAAQQVWDAFMRLLEPEYRKAYRAGEWDRGKIIDQIQPVFHAPTIHGCRVALANARGIRRKIARLWNSPNNHGGGTIQIDDYLAVVTDAVGRSAARFDPTWKVKFTTYAHKSIKGAYSDWKAAASQNPTISLSPPGDISQDDYTRFLQRQSSDKMKSGEWQPIKQSDYKDDYLQGEPPPKSLTLKSLNFSSGRRAHFYWRDRRWDDTLRKRIKAEANLNVLQEVVFDNLVSSRPRDWKTIAEQLGVSAKDEIYTLIKRTMMKVAPVLRDRYFVRPKHD